ncbi:WXG100 family type VII secretion target [Nocardia flavorosea]|uniref:WXG100 family type VII secretion target n=1 Tax=Nocardia flavorosea TaxID=53429 RepID=UPI001893C87A|nr:WXG100 family type VII secretion target [Nocardia flavorosea]MBF6351512.1 WXG100 family type VII secretion target [Nocardia flavorosea]
MVWWRSDEAEKNKETDQQIIEDQDKKWGDDRVAVGKEWSGLLGEWSGQFAPPAILEEDGFGSMTHQQIWDALQTVNSALINDKATAWRDLTTKLRDADKQFLDGVNQDLEAGWNGQSGTAAVNGVREFSTSMASLAASFQMVAHGLDLIEGHLAQAKASVGKPDDETWEDSVTNFLLDDDVFKTPQYRADEAQETARHVMTTYYEPGAEEVDRKTPILPEPVKPVDDGSKPPPGTTPSPGNDTTNGNNNGTDTGTNTGDPGQQPTGEDPQSTEPQSAEPQSTTPQSTAPQSTTPQSTTPTTPSLTTGSPTAPGTPGIPAGTPSGVPQTTAPHIPGQTVPGGNPNKPVGAPAATAPANTAGRAGRTGMPGMMAPGARGANRDEDDEHEIPDYLIYDRGSELLGTQPPALPPGGVIGG